MISNTSRRVLFVLISRDILLTMSFTSLLKHCLNCDASKRPGVSTNLLSYASRSSCGI